jgi:hypothetical protein
VYGTQQEPCTVNVLWHRCIVRTAAAVGQGIVASKVCHAMIAHQQQHSSIITNNRSVKSGVRLQLLAWAGDSTVFVVSFGTMCGDVHS